MQNRMKGRMKDEKDEDERTCRTTPRGVVDAGPRGPI